MAKAKPKRKPSARRAAKPKAKPAAAARAGAARAAGKGRVRIRMYRQGVGDCFLLTFPRRNGGVFNFVIDCGVHQSQSGGADTMRKVVADLAKAPEWLAYHAMFTLIATLSGFVLAVVRNRCGAHDDTRQRCAACCPVAR